MIPAGYAAIALAAAANHTPPNTHTRSTAARTHLRCTLDEPDDGICGEGYVCVNVKELRMALDACDQYDKERNTLWLQLHAHNPRPYVDLTDTVDQILCGVYVPRNVLQERWITANRLAHPDGPDLKL